MNRKPTEARKAEIVDAAMNIIAHEGIKKFTAQHIADKIGVTAGAIFRHFANMDEIIDAIIIRIEECLFEDFPPEGDTPFEQLEQFFHKRIQVVAGNTPMSRILLSDHLSHLGGKKRSARVKELKKRSQVFVKQCLQESMQQNLISADINPEAIAIIILGSILSIGHSTTRVTSERAAQDLSQEIWQAIRKMLCPATITKEK